MQKIIHILFAIVGYVSTATVVTAVLGIAYLWHTDRLNDEKTFRMVALLQDVDLQQLGEARKGTEPEVPPEELSLDEVLQHQHVLDRNFEVKLLALQRGRQEYEHQLRQLKEQTERYDRLAQEWQDKLKQQEQLTTQENVAKVVRDLEQVKPATAKDLLMRWVKEDRMDDVILLMNKMSENKMGKILKTFESPEELDKLHEIHQRMINGGQDNPAINAAIGELKTLKGAIN
jgi:hypothetical protein